jgi:hypothetical protein
MLVGLAPDSPPFLPSAARLIVSSVNSFLHFVPLLIVSPFSRSMAYAISRHWGKRRPGSCGSVSRGMTTTMAMAISAQATIIPVVMTGGRDIMPRGE